MPRQRPVEQGRCLRNETALGSGDLGGSASTYAKLLYQPVGTEQLSRGGEHGETWTLARWTKDLEHLGDGLGSQNDRIKL